MNPSIKADIGTAKPFTILIDLGGDKKGRIYGKLIHDGPTATLELLPANSNQASRIAIEEAPVETVSR